MCVAVYNLGVMKRVSGASPSQVFSFNAPRVMISEPENTSRTEAL